MKKTFDKNDIKQWEGIYDLIQNLVNNFGKINKNDLEVALMDLLLKNKFNKDSDFQISYSLGIPESKIKRLRYEVELLHPKNESDYLDDFYKLINKSTVKQDGEKLLIYIGDKMLRAFISNRLIEMGSFAEAKSSNILCITPIDLIILILKMDNSHNELDKIIEKMQIHNKQLQKSTKENIKNGVIEFISGLGNKINGNMVNWLISTFNQIDDKDIDKILNYKNN